MAVLTHIYRYPVKGLSPEPLHEVNLSPGRSLPVDRLFALARPGGAVNPESPRWARKSNFLCLMLDEQLAAVRTEFDDTSRRLTVWQDGVPVVAASVDTADGRRTIEGFFHHLVGDTLPASPRFISADDGEFMDSQDRTVSLLNLATVRALEARWGQDLDLRRFRANLVIDGIEAWVEHQWIGATLAVGETRLYVDRRNPRCAATNVDPATGARDRDIPRALMDSFGHRDLGLNLHVRVGGRLRVGDEIALAAE